MNGLQLWVFPSGSRLWRYAYRHHGKQKLLALGIYPDVTLSQARKGRDDAKELLAQGHDPSRTKKLARLEAQYSADSFEAVANEYVEKLRREGRAEATLTKVEWLLSLAIPDLGSSSVKTIRPIEILDVLRKVEKRGRYDTARRLRSTIGAVFRYAVATTRAEVDPTVPLQGALTAPTVKPRAAVTEPKAFGALLRAIDGFNGQKTTQAALKLMALMFPRPGELRLAQWPEFDLEEKIWTIPAERTKTRRQHRIPLASQVIKILDFLRPITGGGSLVLPGVRTARQPMSENTFNAA
ncbi:MAG: tyrosine-type recombinase/integrase, partial [Rhizomicrobium sp.]